MGLYELQVRVAFNGSWSTPGTWTDITPYVRLTDGVTWSRGSAADDRPLAPGTAEFALNNDDGRFSPGRAKLKDGTTSNPYGGVRLRVPVNIRVRYPRATGTWYDLWTGWVDDWGSAGTSGVRGVARVKCSDVVTRMPAARGNLRSALVETAMGMGPTDFWSLSGPSAGPWNVNLVPGRPPLRLQRSTSGGTAAIDYDSGAVGPDDTQVALTPASSSDYWTLRSSAVGGAMFAAVVTRSSTGAYAQIARTDYQDNTGAWKTSFSLGLDADGVPVVGDGVVTETLNPWLGVPDDGLPHLVIVALGLGANRMVYVDGRGAGLNTANPSMGGAVVLGAQFSGRISHVGFWPLLATDPAPLQRALLFGRLAGDWVSSVLSWSRVTTSYTHNAPVAYPDYYMAPPMAGRPAADVLADLVNSELGRMYAARSGGLVFDARQRRYRPPVAWSVPAAAVSGSADFPFDLTELANDINVGVSGGMSVSWSDQGSIDAYGPAPRSIDAPLTSPEQGQAIAEWVGSSSSVPRPRADDITVDMVTKAASLPSVPAVIATDPGARVQVTGLPHWSPVDTLDVVVDAIADRFDTAGWQRTFTVSPAAPWSDVWVIEGPGDSGKVEAGNVVAL